MWSWADPNRGLRPLLLAGLVLLLAVVAGCGYRLAGGENRGAPTILGPGYRAMAIDEVVNPTLMPWVESRLRSIVRDEFTRRRLVEWTDNDTATSLLKIRILRYDNRAKVRNRKDETLKTIADIRLEATVHSAADNTVLWSSGPIDSYQTYQTAEEDEIVEKALVLAVRELADRMGNAF